MLNRFRSIYSWLFVGLIVVMALVPWLFTSYGLQEADIAQRLCQPSSDHFMGCDVYGRDVWTHVLYGARTTLFVCIFTVFLTLALGTFLGIVAGFFGGVVDYLISQVINIFMAFPGILLALALATFLGPSVFNIILTISLTGWTGVARLVRGQVLSIKESSHVMAGRALGASDLRLGFRYILPSLVSPLVVTGTFSLAGVILVESSLTFLGVGVQSEMASWGGLLKQGQGVLLEAPILSIIPGLFIFNLVLAFNFLGDEVREHFNKRAAF